MNLHDLFFGNRKERISNLSFKMMATVIGIIDVFAPRDRRLQKFGIKEGDVVIDYGCGPGSYIKKASETVGKSGRVYAIDVHEMAMEYVRKKILKHHLGNVVPVLADGNSCQLDDHIADVILALDMFHMVRDPNAFLKELRRLIKTDGVLIIDPGHQPLEVASSQITESGLWRMESESNDHLRCIPLS